MQAPPFDEVRRQCAAAIESAELRDVASALARAGVDEAQGHRFVAEISEHDARVRDRLVAVRSAIGSAAGSLERLLLLRSAVQALDRVPQLPVSEDVKRLFCESFHYMAAPPDGVTFNAARDSFVALCKVASLRRFPAGQYHWEISGLPRSWVLKVSGRDRLTLMWWIATKLKGFAPICFIHLNAHRKNRFVLTERESERSYFRVAQALALQPHLKGLVTSSWLNSPDTFAISPHLAWINRTFVENGGFVATMGPAEPDCGVLARSPERTQAYQAGTFTPTLGLVVWPREAMLAWAAAHPELGHKPARVLRARKEIALDAVAGHAR